MPSYGVGRGWIAVSPYEASRQGVPTVGPSRCTEPSAAAPNACDIPTPEARRSQSPTLATNHFLSQRVSFDQAFLQEDELVLVLVEFSLELALSLCLGFIEWGAEQQQPPPTLLALAMATPDLSEHTTQDLQNSLENFDLEEDEEDIEIVLDQFERAAARLAAFTATLGNDVLLEVPRIDPLSFGLGRAAYALYKIVTVGKCNTPRPGLFEFAKKAK
ncbi:hypothetical protein BDK51DRAFT_45425, partial [Blyttiomyces helicus]